MGKFQPGSGTTHYRLPWLWVAALLVAAIAATWLINANATSRAAQNRRQFEAQQSLRLARIEQRIDDYFSDAVQLATSTSETLLLHPRDDAANENTVLALYRSRQNKGVYGVGVFSAPYGLDPRTWLYSVYVHSYATLEDRRGVVLQRYDHILPGGIDEVVFHNDGSYKAGDYTKREWFRDAVQSPDATVFYGPFSEDNRSFISTERAVRSAGKIVAVVSVDTLAVKFTSAMRSGTAPGDVAYIESGSSSHMKLLATSALPSDTARRIDRGIPLRYSRASVHLSSDADPLRAENDQLVSWSVTLTIVTWVLGGLLAFLLSLHWRARDATAALERERLHLANEITIAKEVEAVLRKDAYTDSLTGLANRAAFWENAASALAAAQKGDAYSVFFIDLDRFNMINDTRGHLAGDELLKAIANRLRSQLDKEISVARLGGDEFVVLAKTSGAAAAELARTLLRIVNEPMLLGGGIVDITASIGVVVVENGYERPEDLLRDADIAMYHAKRAGRARYAMFDTEMRRRVARDSQLGADLRAALDRDEFVPYYQPIVDIATGKIASFEALVRWNRPARGIAGAADFVGYAESQGLIQRIDEIVLRAVCRDAVRLFEHFPNTTVAVNVSAADLTAPDLASTIAAVLKEYGVAHSRIRIELTETAVMIDPAQAYATLDELRRYGVQIILDDFGSGHSSLSYLHRLPIAGVKIDRSFTTALAFDPQAVAIVRTIVTLAHTLGFFTVAEGVETIEQLEVLRGLGVTNAQGFLFSPAVDLASLVRLTDTLTAS